MLFLDEMSEFGQHFATQSKTLILWSELFLLAAALLPLGWCSKGFPRRAAAALWPGWRNSGNRVECLRYVSAVVCLPANTFCRDSAHNPPNQEASDGVIAMGLLLRALGLFSRSESR